MFLTALALHAATVQQCRTMDTRLPAELRGWKVAGRGLDTGHAVILNAGRDHQASTSVTIRKAGTFGIALDQAGWIDVAPARGKALESSDHAHGPDCSTIRKIVQFKLKPGTYRVSLSKLTGATARLMLVRY